MSTTSRVIMGYAQEIPQVGKCMRVIQCNWHFAKGGKTCKCTLSDWRDSTEVMTIKSLDEMRIFAVETRSGQQYIVQIIER